MAQQPPQQQWGCTPPLSTRQPTAADESLTAELEEFMRQAQLYETEAGMERRRATLAKLEQLLVEWAEEQAPHHSDGRQAARLFTFGSYKLGVVAPTGDVDAVCVTANSVTREGFFNTLLATLRGHPAVSRVQSVPDAFTPIIKFTMDGVDVDLLFARLALPRLPSPLEDLNDDGLLRNVDEKTVRSLNGCRVATDLVALVPNKETFVTTLRFIKYWAVRRGVYSNAFGYLGGISWALLVGRLCQLYPYAVPALLVLKFFTVFSKWDWACPVQLCAIKEYPGEAGLMSFQVWNPKVNVLDRLHLMPVITPSFPGMNSTYNVTQTTRAIMQTEFVRGYEQCQAVRRGEATWADVAAPADFFASAFNFLEVHMAAESDLAFGKLKGYVESRIRILIRRIEMLETVALHLWPETICAAPPDGAAHGARDGAVYLALHPLSPEVQDLDLEPIMSDFVPTIATNWADWEQYKDSINLTVSHVTQRELPEFVLQYRRSLGLSEPLPPYEEDEHYEDESSVA